VRVGVTILCLMLLVGPSLAAEIVAANAPSSSGAGNLPVCPVRTSISDGCPFNNNIAGSVRHAGAAMPLTTGSESHFMPGLSWVDSTAAPSPGRYWCPGTGVYRDTIWFLGGRMSAQVSTRSMTAYDITNNQWITSGLPTLTTPRRTGGGGVIGHKIYVAGGKDSSSTILSSCEEFDLDTRTLTSKASMPTGYWAVASAVAGDKLYIIGNESSLGTTYEYNPAVDSWTTKATLSVGRGWACAAGANGLIYVMGGSDAGGSALSDCWCFDPAANSWAQKASMPGPRMYSTAVAYGDSVVYVIGGSSAGTALGDKLVYAYQIATNTWSAATSKPTASGWTMANVAGGAIFVAYGSDCVTPTYLTTLDVATAVIPQAHDVTLSAIVAPPTSMNQGSVNPVCTIKNVGLNAESNIPVTCWIDSAGTRIYSVTDTLPGPLAPDASVNDTFMPAWTTGPSGAQYTVTMFAALSSDSTPANDTLHRNTTITGPGVQESPELKFALNMVTPGFVRGQAPITYYVVDGGEVSLNVYDATGTLVKTLAGGFVTPGVQTAIWNRTDDSGRHVAGGTYFYRLSVNGKSVSSKAIVLK
jgi:hypothetical protein